MKRYLAALIAVLSVVPCGAGTITVDDNGPAAYKSIQEALNHSWQGDVIVVKPGTYAERLTFNGRAVTVRSENPDDPAVVQATVITGGTGSNPTVTFDFNEGERSVLEGLTITGRGILCMGTSPTISKNVIRNCTGQGITGRNDAAPTITGSMITANQQEGIYGCGGLIQGNTITRNLTGVAFCGGPVQDNRICENAPGGGLAYCSGLVAGNLISGNRCDTYGGGLANCAGVIRHNVIAGNRADRQGGGLYNCTQSITNNTIVSNVAGDQGGGLCRCPGVVRDNIIARSVAPVGAGIYGAAVNSYNAFWDNVGGNFAGGAATGAGDVIVEPLFARDGYWDASLWTDGDYHLKSQAGRWDPQQRRWVTDNVTCRCIDAGDPQSDGSAELWPHGQRVNVGAYGGTPQASMSLSSLGALADLNRDAQVNPADLRRLAQKWLRVEDLLAEDLDRDGRVDLRDLAFLGEQWRRGPSADAPPLPDPMTWAVRPYATGPYTIGMVATTAASTDGTGVEYWFEDAQHPDYNSGWLSFAPGQEVRWGDSELSPESTYWYHVKARNKGNQIETGWSESASAKTLQEDWTAPSPNPMTWETEPYRTGPGALRMVAAAAGDLSGVEYQFECTSNTTYNSDWQDSRTYDLSALPPAHYTFVVRARDKSLNRNTTGGSNPASVDLQPPLPNPLTWEIQPKEVQLGAGPFDYGATMKATEAVDESAQVEYYFECTSDARYSSGWQSSREYTVKLGRQGMAYRFRAKARDTSAGHNETGYTSELPAR